MYMDTYDIRNVNGHYELSVNGKFYGSYDTAVEAAQEIDNLREGKEAWLNGSK